MLANQHRFTLTLNTCPRNSYIFVDACSAKNHPAKLESERASERERETEIEREREKERRIEREGFIVEMNERINQR